MLKFLSLAAAITLTEFSESTFRRRFLDGSISREILTGSGKSMIYFESIRPYVKISLTEEDLITIENADAGDSNAQDEVGILFLENNKAKSAIYWFEAAAKNGNSDAMHWLARCYLSGNGTFKDENVGMMWLSKSAAGGHPISMAQMQAIRDRVLGI